MVKLGVDHPYHVLYQLLSLQNGDRDSRGQAGSLASNQGVMQQNVDVDKIQAAASVIQQIAQHPTRCWLTFNLKFIALLSVLCTKYSCIMSVPSLQMGALP